MSEPKTKTVYWDKHAWEIPESDALCFSAITKDAELIPEVIRRCRRFDLCVQAGGNVGVYPSRLANDFKQVLTWEPSPENFYCLRENTDRWDIGNIFAFNAALGDSHFPVSIELPEAINCGTYRVTPPGEVSVPVMMLDDLHLDRCDLIWLDIEGYELRALRGAAATIERHKPVIAVEVKDHCRRYGYSEADLCGWILAQGYTYAACVKDDRVFVPRETP